MNPTPDPWGPDPEPEPQEPPAPPKGRLTDMFERWTKTYERHLEEFASETGGVPTVAHVRRAEQLADREMRQLYSSMAQQ